MPVYKNFTGIRTQLFIFTKNAQKRYKKREKDKKIAYFFNRFIQKSPIYYPSQIYDFFYEFFWYKSTVNTLQMY